MTLIVNRDWGELSMKKNQEVSDLHPSLSWALILSDLPALVSLGNGDGL